MKIIKDIEKWYLAQCNEEWERHFGIDIQTLENPGWLIKIDLNNTNLENKPLDEFKENYEHETDWMICFKKKGVFEGIGGPEKLGDILNFFIKWKNS